jgi:hypothetical protein
MIRHESSQSNTHSAAAAIEAPTRLPADAPRSVDDALRLAIKLAVDVGDYDRATALLDVARRTAPRPASVTPLSVARERGRT